MRKVKIITDSCSDLTAELLEKYDIDYCKMCTVEKDMDIVYIVFTSECRRLSNI